MRVLLWTGVLWLHFFLKVSVSLSPALRRRDALRDIPTLWDRQLRRPWICLKERLHTRAPSVSIIISFASWLVFHSCCEFKKPRTTENNLSNLKDKNSFFSQRHPETNWTTQHKLLQTLTQNNQDTSGQQKNNLKHPETFTTTWSNRETTVEQPNGRPRTTGKTWTTWT